MTKKSLPLDEVLAVHTGIVLPTGDRSDPLGPFFRVMEHLTGQTLLTSNLRVLLAPSDEELVRQHPFLDGLEAPEMGPRETLGHYTNITLPAWTDRLKQQYGAAIEVEQRPEAFPRMGPFDGMPEGMEIIVVKMEEQT